MNEQSDNAQRKDSKRANKAPAESPLILTTIESLMAMCRCKQKKLFQLKEVVIRGHRRASWFLGEKHGWRRAKQVVAGVVGRRGAASLHAMGRLGWALGTPRG